jgi:hypothetical protein
MNPTEKIVAFWRIKTGRIVAVLFDYGDGTYRFRTDNSGGYIVPLKMHVVLGTAESVAIEMMSEKVAESYKTARMVLGAPVCHVS